MRSTRMTTRRWMALIAASAVMLPVTRYLRCNHSDHPYYWANKAAASRRYERWAWQQAASARTSADEYRRKARAAGALDQDRHESEAKRHEEKALLLERWADGAAQEGKEYLKASREGGYRPSELPPHVRQEMKLEELDK